MSELNNDDQQIRSLSAVRPGQTVQVVKVDAGRGLNTRLISMGLVPNAKITVLSNRQPGPFVIAVKGSKVVLGRGMANKIVVK